MQLLIILLDTRTTFFSVANVTHIEKYANLKWNRITLRLKTDPFDVLKIC